jgi:hypothetical protein
MCAMAYCPGDPSISLQGICFFLRKASMRKIFKRMRPKPLRFAATAIVG